MQFSPFFKNILICCLYLLFRCFKRVFCVHITKNENQHELTMTMKLFEWR